MCITFSPQSTLADNETTSKTVLGALIVMLGSRIWTFCFGPWEFNGCTTSLGGLVSMRIEVNKSESTIL